MRTLATAGHVDHGKSTLVEALTGVHPDRLKEEREREMSIDLGYAYLTLPNGVEVGIVDVPGHHDFIANMLAGVGGVDAVLLVVAADEGVMPQTREHVAILDLLGVSHGLVALTKIDLAPDSEWLDLVEEETRDLLRGTILREAPIVRVSARTGQGLARLQKVLAQILERVPSRPDWGRPRLPVDRSFTLRGFGTIVTGTLTDGVFHVGQEVEILPRGLRARIRSIQSHKKARERALPGARTALNLVGVKKTQVTRGDVVVGPGTYRPTRRLDVELRVLSDAPVPLKHNQWLKLHLWTWDGMARLRLLGTEALKPGEVGLAQLELSAPVVAEYGDRFILRRASPEATVAGGRVLNPYPEGRYKRFDEKVLGWLCALAQGSPREVVEQALRYRGWLTEPAVESLPIAGQDAREILASLVEEGKAIPLSDEGARVWIWHVAWETWWQRLWERLVAYHARFPERLGVLVGEVLGWLGLDEEVGGIWLHAMAQRGSIRLHRGFVALPEHQPRFSKRTQENFRQLLARFRNAQSPPHIQTCIEALGKETYQTLVVLGHLIPLNDKYVLDRETYQQWQARVIQALHQAPQGLTVAQIRDILGTSRRLTLAFLEHLDAQGVTCREGDFRRLVDK